MTVRAFLHYALEVPDQQVGQRFYADLGLQDSTGRSDVVRLRPAAVGREQLLLYPGPRKRLHHVAFGAPDEGFQEVRAALRAAGVRLVDPPRDAPEGGLWFRDPDGNLVNVRDEPPVGMAPDPPPAYNTPGHPARLGTRAIEPARMGTASPRRLSHALLFSPDLERQAAFYRSVLGLRLSDRVPGAVVFMRCSTDHHNFGFIASDRPGFHHAAFEVGTVDEIALGAVRMRERGWQPAWGLGRHVIGSNFFYYIRDPWGSYAEYSFDMDYIPTDCPWEARDWEPEHALYLWGPDVPPDFRDNHER